MSEPIAQRLESGWRWLARELAPFPGRGQFALRVTLACAIAIVISETFQVPEMAASLAAVVFTAQANITMTRVVCAVLVVANLISVALCVALLHFTYDYPVLRIVCSSVIFFVFMFCVRVSKACVVLLGPALVVLYAQSFVDMTGQTDYLVRQILWAVVALTYGSVLAVLVNSLFSSAHPEYQLHAEVHRQLEQVIDRLRRLAANDAVNPAPLPEELQRHAAALLNLLNFADMARPKDRTANAYRRACVAAVSRAQHICRILPGALPEVSPALRRVLGRLQDSLPDLERAVAGDMVFRLAWQPCADERAALASLQPANDLYRTLQAIDHLNGAAVSEPVTAKEPLFAPDAFSNPVHVRFALKTLICALAGYFIFNSLQWPGIHTVLITSVLVALPGTGTSVRQMTLRFYGALFGSLIALLVFLVAMPHIDTIAGLLLVILPIMGLAAWVAAGSERMAYVGTQCVVTVALALFEHYGPSTDLTEIRDRMVGILLGVCICWLVYAFIWPDSESSAARNKLAALLQELAELVRAPLRQDDAAQQIVYARRQLKCWSSLNECDMQLERLRYEPQFKRRPFVLLNTPADSLLAAVREVLAEQDRARSLVCVAPAATTGAAAAIVSAQTLRNETASLIERFAACVAGGGEPPAAEQEKLRAHARRIGAAGAPPLVAHTQRLAYLAADLPGWARPADAAEGAAAGSRHFRKAQ